MPSEDSPHPAINLRELAYPANLLTLLRLALLPFTINAMRRPDRRRETLVWIGVAMLTDAVDGPLARRRGEVSRLGQILDPIADKLTLGATMITLSRCHGFPWWATALLLVRDVGILLAALFIYRRKSRIMVARSMGKATTVTLTAAALLYIADGPRSGKPALYLALAPLTLSVLQYSRHFLRLLHEEEPPQ